MKIKFNNTLFIILSILAIISFIVIIKCYFFTNVDIIKNIVIISKEMEPLFLDISIGYVVSYIFYIIQIYIPENIKKRKFIKSNKKAISGLINLIKEVNLCIGHFFYISNNGNISALNEKPMVIKLLNDENNNCYWCTEFNINDLIGENSIFDIISNKVEKIKNTILFEYLDIEFMKILSDIENSCTNIKKILLSVNINNSYQHSSNEICWLMQTLEKGIIEICKYTNCENDQFQIANDEEIDIFKECMNKHEGNIQQVENSRLYIKVDFSKIEVKEKINK